MTFSEAMTKPERRFLLNRRSPTGEPARGTVLVEFSILPLGRDTHVSEEITQTLKLVADSGLPYQLTPEGTCIEGGWNDVMGLIHCCHARVREFSPHVVTTIHIEDEAGATNKLVQNAVSVTNMTGGKGCQVTAPPAKAEFKAVSRSHGPQTNHAEVSGRFGRRTA